MSERKTSQYFKYAIGEIFLVVVGILIAFSINNWKEGLKRDTAEMAILKEIKSGLEKDSLSINRAIGTLKLAEEGIRQAQRYLDNLPVNLDSVGYNFAWTLFETGLDLSIVPYENLKTQGIDLISSNDTRASVISYYENNYDIARESSSGSFLKLDDFRRQAAVHFENIAFFEDIEKGRASIRSMMPRNLKKLKQDNLYRTYLNTRLADIETMIYFTFESIQEIIEEVKEKINQQISEIE